MGRCRYWVGSTEEHITFAHGTALPNHFVHQRYPDPSAYVVSPAGHANALELVPSVYNLTGPDNRTAPTPQTFVGRRQEHVEFTYQVTLEFDPNEAEDGAEAGITVFLNRAFPCFFTLILYPHAQPRSAQNSSTSTLAS
jgi:hypothetical protein